MTRASFGGNAGDFVFDVTAGRLVRIAAGEVTFWTAQTGGTQYTDLLLNGDPVTKVPVGDAGELPDFQGPDGILVMWAESNSGPRVKVISITSIVAQVSAIAGLTGEDAAVASLIGSSTATRTAGDGRWVQSAKRPVSLRNTDVATVDFTGATDSAAAVQSIVTAAGAGAVIDVDLRGGIIRCDSTITLLQFQHLRGSVQKAGGGPTAATFDFSHLGATATAINASAGSCQLTDIHLVGPGSNNTSSKGVFADGSGGSAITLTRVTSQRFGHGAHLTSQFYAGLTEVELIYNRVGLTLSGCYNVNLYRPKIYCSGTDSYKGIGISTGTVRGLNVWGGSIEDYGTIVGTPNDAGIVVGSGSLVNVFGTYFEAPASANAVGIDLTAATGYILNVHGCEVYLNEHRAFIDCEGSTSAGTINTGGNQFNCAASTTPATPNVYLLGSNTGLVVNVGTAEIDSMHGVTLSAVAYIDNQGTATDKQTVRVPRELLSGSGQGGLFMGDALRTPPSTTSRSGVRVPHGTAPTSPADGDVWSTTTGVFARVNGTTQQLANRLTNTAALDFPSIAAAGQQELTITVTGAAVGDAVLLGPPSTLTAGLIATARVSAADTVTIRLSNITGSAIDPASATWRATVLR